MRRARRKILGLNLAGHLRLEKADWSVQPGMTLADVGPIEAGLQRGRKKSTPASKKRPHAVIPLYRRTTAKTARVREWAYAKCDYTDFTSPDLTILGLII